MTYQQRCNLCEEPAEDGEADHIVPLWKGGEDIVPNMQWLCKPCHRAKTIRESAERAALLRTTEDSQWIDKPYTTGHSHFPRVLSLSNSTGSPSSSLDRKEPMSVNKVILVGNLGADPETREAGSGMKIANLRLATSERAKGADGEWGDHTEWHRVVCFGKTAENCERFLAKGRQVYVEGKIRTRKWEDKSGQERWTTEVVADVVRFLGGGTREEVAPKPARASRGGGGRRANFTQRPALDTAPLDDVPF